MSVRVYLELEIVEGKCPQAVCNALDYPFVLTADWLEDSSKVMVVLEAPDRISLGRDMMAVLRSVENITENINLNVGQEISSDTRLPELQKTA